MGCRGRVDLLCYGEWCIQRNAARLCMWAGHADFLNGKIADLSEWDDEELMRGMRRDKGGKFRGRRVRLVPAACLKELHKRQFSRAHDLLNESLVDGALALREIIKDETHPDRVKAIELLFNRVLGAAPQHVSVDVGVTAPWMEMITASIVGNDAQTQPVVDVKPALGQVIAPDSKVAPARPAPDTPAPLKAANRMNPPKRK